MSPPHATRIFLVDEQPLVREGLVHLLAHQSDLHVCGESRGGSVLEAIAAAHPDVAILDLSHGRSGLELIKDLHHLHPEIAVLVLSAHDEMTFAERALRSGARGYVMKREATQEVVRAIRRVREGGVWVSERVSAALAERIAGGGPSQTGSPLECLSDRELEVFRLLGQGRATRQIADDLRVSAKTVQAYCARIKEKLGLANATQLLREAIRWHEEQTTH